MRFNLTKCIYGFVFALLAVSVLFLSSKFLNTKAENPALWLSIDAAELNKVLSEARLSGNELHLDIVATEKGIAVLRADDWQMQQISSYMHEHFHKCGGFIAHESKEDAIESIDRMFAADLSESLVDYTIDNAVNVNQLLAEAQESPIRQTIMELSENFPNRRFNQPSGMESANFIKNKWAGLTQSRSDITVEFFNHTTSVSPQPSVILTIQGTELPGEEIVLGAHQDSINSSGQTASAPGADDDASGIASLTETIRVIVEKDFRPKRTVKFMAYAAEEVGLRGSRAIATDYRARNVNVIGVMQLDMTNFKGTTNLDVVLISDRTNAAQNQFIRDLLTAYQPGLNVGTSSCGYACSDHASWTEKNYPASFPFEATLSNSNSAIHTSNDTISRSNSNAFHALKFTKLALSFVGELAKGDIENQAPGKARADFDGDGKTDVSVFRPDTGVWYLNQSTNGFLALNWGIATDRVVPADYNGDGKTDIAVFRANNDANLPDFYILETANFTFSGFSWGIEGDIPAVSDYDGDGKDDISIFRPSTNTWYILKSSDGSFLAQTFGQGGDKPVNGDFDGDGKADLNLLRNNNQWIVYKSSTNYSSFDTFNFGLTGDIPVPADFDGDSTDNIAVFRPSNGTWYYLRPDGSTSVLQFGANGDVPATGDYDGDGISDFAVYRPSSGIWYILRSSNLSYQIESFGLPADSPIPFNYQH